MRYGAIAAAIVVAALLGTAQPALADVRDILFVNPDQTSYAGQTAYLSPSEVGQPLTNDQSADQSTDQASTSNQTAAAAPQPAAPAPVTPQPVIYTVASGDTLSSIATQYQTTYVRLFDANQQIADPNVIDVGVQIRIPAADEVLPDRPLPANAVTISRPTTSTRHYSAPAPVTNATVASAKAYIYDHESHNNPNATNSRGCYGLGQDCSGTVRAQCGADYACQDAYFTNYANSRYGGWLGALAFWQNHHWW